MRKIIRVLSIDGGGIRGIIPAKVLVKIEQLLQEFSQNPKVKISDYFDLVAGTSTGSILTGLYLSPEQIGSSRAKYSAQEVLDLYLKYGTHIFERSWKTKGIDYFGLATPMYKAEPLEKMLDVYFGETRLEDLVKPCLIPAYDVEHGDAIFFNQMNAYQNETSNFLVKDVVRASTAAPTYFPVAQVKDESTNPNLTLIDGGMFANNPALCAYVEACKFPFNPAPTDIMILSLGTGSRGRTYPYKDSKSWGKVGWMIPVIDIYGSAASQTVDHQLKMIYQCNQIKNQYLRIEPNLSNFDVSLRMDDATPKNIAALVAVGEAIVELYADEIRAFTRKLYMNQIGRPVDEFYRMSETD